MMTKEKIRDLIASAIDCDELEVRGDDGQHFDATIVAQTFAGKSRVQRHQIVYAALGKEMGEAIHALSFKALAPGERTAIPRQA